MPRKYQQQAIVKINQALNAGYNPIYCAPCRTGKTKTTAFVIESRKQIKETFFILVPSFEIFDQWCLEFSQSGIDYGYINAVVFVFPVRHGAQYIGFIPAFNA